MNSDALSQGLRKAGASEALKPHQTLPTPFDFSSGKNTKESCFCEDNDVSLKNYQTIPEELKTHQQWVCWKLKPNPYPSKKPIKQPINPKTDYDANPTIVTLCNWRHKRKGSDYTMIASKPMSFEQGLLKFPESNKVTLNN